MGKSVDFSKDKVKNVTEEFTTNLSFFDSLLGEIHDSKMDSLKAFSITFAPTRHCHLRNAFGFLAQDAFSSRPEFDELVHSVSEVDLSLDQVSYDFLCALRDRFSGEVFISHFLSMGAVTINVAPIKSAPVGVAVVVGLRAMVSALELASEYGYDILDLNIQYGNAPRAEAVARRLNSQSDQK